MQVHQVTFLKLDNFYLNPFQNFLNDFLRMIYDFMKDLFATICKYLEICKISNNHNPTLSSLGYFLHPWIWGTPQNLAPSLYQLEILTNYWHVQKCLYESFPKSLIDGTVVIYLKNVLLLNNIRNKTMFTDFVYVYPSSVLCTL